MSNNKKLAPTTNGPTLVSSSKTQPAPKKIVLNPNPAPKTIVLKSQSPPRKTIVMQPQKENVPKTIVLKSTSPVASSSSKTISFANKSNSTYSNGGLCVGKCGNPGVWRSCTKHNICAECKNKDEFKLISQYSVLEKFKPTLENPNGITRNDLFYAQKYKGLRVFRIPKPNSQPGDAYPFNWYYYDWEIKRLYTMIQAGEIDISDNPDMSPEDKANLIETLISQDWYKFKNN